MLKKIIDGINSLEEKIQQSSENNTHLFSYNKMYMISSNTLYKEAEYNHQPYTFKYGDYSIKDYLKNYS